MVVLGISCEDRQPLTEEYKLVVPKTFDSLPNIPAYNLLTAASVELGEKLFNDVRLSGEGGISCASCHKKEFAFADNRALSPGVHGRIDARNSPSLLNVAYQKRLFLEGGIPSLERQAIAPFSNENEMNFSVHNSATKLAEVTRYQELSRKAYGTELNPKAIAYALASYERSLISKGSRYDDFVMGDSSALSPAEVRGMNLFFDSKNACASCHSGFLFTDQNYYNIGLYENYREEGRARITLDSADLGKVKTPSLRNVRLTAPYFHDGSAGSLLEVLDHYNRGGFNHANKDSRILALNLSEEEKRDIVSFLGSLTDKNYEKQP
jgi:cytochrome c peroxidase